MQTSRPLYYPVLVLLMPAAISVTAVLAQDPVRVAPEHYKLILDNEHVRVCEVTLRPGAKVPTHRHEDQLLYFRSGGKLKMTYPDAKSREMEQEAGDTVWVSAETHDLENIGSTEVRVAVFELKRPGQGGDDPGKATVRVLFENDRVRALDVRVKPGDREQPNWHPAYVFYALSDLKFERPVADGKSAETILRAGQAAWNEPAGPPAPRGTAAAEHVVIIELKDARDMR